MLRLEIVDTQYQFEVVVKDDDKIVERLDWHGGLTDRDTHPFEYDGKAYVVFGPYHSFQGKDNFRLFEMTEVAQA